VIGASRLWNWCNETSCATLFGHLTMGQPVVVCHEADLNVSSCCTEPGQLPLENFTSLVECATTALVFAPTTTLATMSTATLPQTNRPEPDTPSKPLDAALVLGAAGGIGLVLLIGVVLCIIQWRRRRAGTNAQAPSQYGVLPLAKPAQATYDDVVDVQQQGRGMYDSPLSPLQA
jgi:hypothetical protein